MATPRLLDFSSRGDSDDNSPSSPSHSRRKFRRKPALKRRASESQTEEEETKMNNRHSNKKLASPVRYRIWNEEDELTILKGLVDYRVKTRFQPKIDWDAFYRFLGGSIVAKVSKEQLSRKVRKMKWKFFVHLERINQGKDPLFTRASDSEAFGYCSMLWDKNEAEFANEGMDKALQIESSDEG